MGTRPRAGATRRCCPTSSAPRTTSAARANHGLGGPLSGQRQPFLHSPRRTVIEAALEGQGIEPNPDPNGAAQDGAGRCQVTRATAAAVSTAVGLSPPAIRGRKRRGAHRHARDRPLRGEPSRRGRGASKDNGQAARGACGARGARSGRRVSVASPPHALGLGAGGELGGPSGSSTQELPSRSDLQDHPVISVVWLSSEESLRAGLTPTNARPVRAEGRGPFQPPTSARAAAVRERVTGWMHPDVRASTSAR